MALLPLEGWVRGHSYRVTLTGSLTDTAGRTLTQARELALVIPAEGAVTAAAPPDLAVTYDSVAAASSDLGGRFPGGQTMLFQGLWTDPTTGLAYARNRWYDPHNASWLSEDPAGAVDSSNLYAFVGWGPNSGTDPMGLCWFTGFDDVPCSVRLRDLKDTAASATGFTLGLGVAAARTGAHAIAAPVAAATNRAVDAYTRFSIAKSAYEAQGWAGLKREMAIAGRQDRQQLKEQAISMIPGVNTYRQATQIRRTYEEKGAFAGGMQVANTTFSLGLDVSAVYGLAKGVQALRARGGVVPVEPEVAAEGPVLEPVASESPTVKQPMFNSSLPDRVTRELPEGVSRSPAELQQARDFFKNHRELAREWWEERTGRQWPSDATHYEHPRSLKEGGNPLFVKPGFGGPTSPHMVVGPDGLTDFQRWGAMGGRKAKVMGSTDS